MKCPGCLKGVAEAASPQFRNAEASQPHSANSFKDKLSWLQLNSVTGHTVIWRQYACCHLNWIRSLPSSERLDACQLYYSRLDKLSRGLWCWRRNARTATEAAESRRTHGGPRRDESERRWTLWRHAPAGPARYCPLTGETIGWSCSLPSNLRNNTTSATCDVCFANLDPHHFLQFNLPRACNLLSFIPATSISQL